MPDRSSGKAQRYRRAWWAWVACGVRLAREATDTVTTASGLKVRATPNGWPREYTLRRPPEAAVSGGRQPGAAQKIVKLCAPLAKVSYRDATKLGPIHLYQMLASENLLFYILVTSAKFLTWLYVLAGSPGNPQTPASCRSDSSLGNHSSLIL
jgi:hypothetical protein